MIGQRLIFPDSSIARELQDAAAKEQRGIADTASRLFDTVTGPLEGDHNARCGELVTFSMINATSRKCYLPQASAADKGKVIGIALATSGSGSTCSISVIAYPGETVSGATSLSITESATAGMGLLVICIGAGKWLALGRLS